MRTQKRNRIERAYSLGYKAGIRGKSANLCPYGLAEARGSWMGGWRIGHDDFKAGYLEIADV